MKDYTTKKRYCPHLLETKLHAVEIVHKADWAVPAPKKPCIQSSGNRPLPGTETGEN